MVDKKEALILVLVVSLAITGVGWFHAEMKSESIYFLPGGIENRVEVFHGYEAYLDGEIHFNPIKGTSMEPTFGENDMILWVEVDPSELNVGDIIIYDHPTKPWKGIIAHRIIKIMINDEYRFETKGDNRSESDAETAISAYYVSEEDLRGLVIGVVYSD